MASEVRNVGLAQALESLGLVQGFGLPSKAKAEQRPFSTFHFTPAMKIRGIKRAPKKPTRTIPGRISTVGFPCICFACIKATSHFCLLPQLSDVRVFAVPCSHLEKSDRAWRFPVFWGSFGEKSIFGLERIHFHAARLGLSGIEKVQ